MKKETISYFLVARYRGNGLLSNRINRVGVFWIHANGGAYARYRPTYWLKYRLEEVACYAEAVGLNVHKNST